ncbi:MAG TPA: hypothetical protein VEC37_03045 [Bacillota bacterium]|nr:hypothetical protein [Bacillota bacterium]
MPNQINRLRKKYRKQKAKKQKTSDAERDKFNWVQLMFEVLITCLAVWAHVNIQKIVLTRDSILFGLEAIGVLACFYFFLVMLAFELLGKRNLGFKLWFWGIGLTLLLAISSFYYSATYQGLCLQRLLVGRFIPWKQVQKVNLKISGETIQGFTMK